VEGVLYLLPLCVVVGWTFLMFLGGVWSTRPFYRVYVGFSALPYLESLGCNSFFGCWIQFLVCVYCNSDKNGTL